MIKRNSERPIEVEIGAVSLTVAFIMKVLLSRLFLKW